MCEWRGQGLGLLKVPRPGMWEWRGLRWVSGGAWDEWVEVPGKCEWRGLNLGFVSGGVWIWDVWVEGPRPLMCEWVLGLGCENGGAWAWDMRVEGPGPWDVWVEGLVNKSIKARAVQPPPPSTQGEVPTVFRPDQKPLLSNRANHFLLYPKLTVHCGKKFGHF